MDPPLFQGFALGRPNEEVWEGGIWILRSGRSSTTIGMLFLRNRLRRRLQRSFLGEPPSGWSVQSWARAKIGFALATFQLVEGSALNVELKGKSWSGQNARHRAFL